ncbi:MAG: efflux RND transporter periplasmic adaptor subunit [Vicinamibacterales bacterium]|jgi:RND family efflux transporter MFP subunit|nr:efflux RND transporter periplasmic adaptor subunit [Vicinamibacterales bacterium]
MKGSGVIRPRVTLAAVSLAVALGAIACGDHERTEVAVGGPAPEPAIVEVGPENLVLVDEREISVGPLVSGSLRPASEATVRAEVGGSVLVAAPEEGQVVRKGALLARIEERTLGDAVTSAQSALRSAEQALGVARREAERTERLVKAGAIAERELETAQNAVTAAEAQVDDARTRLASARKVLEDATVRAPISGVVSTRHVSVGDVVSPGRELYTIIDPSTMRLDASVPSEALPSIRVGARVRFEVRGYPGQWFEGRIERISPAADPVTRQVPIFVDIPNAGGRLLAGLFAEGRVTDQARVALVAPLRAVHLETSPPWVLRVRDGKIERVEVKVGLRDDQAEVVELVGGASKGDQLLVGGAMGLAPGTPVRVRQGG